MKCLLAAACLCLPPTSQSETAEIESADNSHIRLFDTAYKASLGKRVWVDVIVWHYTGTSGRGGSEVITPTGQVIYIRDAYVPDEKGLMKQILPQGKLVRIAGTLEFGPAPTHGKWVIATGDARSQLNLRMESFEPIETAQYPWPCQISEGED